MKKNNNELIDFKKIVVKTTIGILLVMPLIVIITYSYNIFEDKYNFLNALHTFHPIDTLDTIDKSTSKTDNPIKIHLIVWTCFFVFILISSGIIIFSIVSKTLENQSNDKIYGLFEDELDD